MKLSLWSMVLIASIMIGIIGCSHQGSTPDDRKSSESSGVSAMIVAALAQDHLLPMAELRPLLAATSSEEHTALFQKMEDLINQTSTEDLQQIIRNEIDRAIASQQIIEVDRFDLGLTQDNLSMNIPKNQKLYNNITISIKIYYPSEQFGKNIVKEQEATQGLADHIMLQLQENTYVYYTLKNIDSSFLTMDNQSRFAYSFQQSFFNNPLSRRQTLAEEAAQTWVYDYVLGMDDDTMLQARGKRPRHNRDVVLAKFGVVEQPKEVYIEILIYAIDSSDNTQAVIDSFLGYSQEICAGLTSDDRCVQYLKENDIQNIHILFDVPWYSGQTVEFDFAYPA